MMHTKSVFDELELITMKTISSKNHIEKNQIRTKKDDDARMQMVCALNERYDQATHLRAPLDSTAIDPITRSPNYHQETGKMENPIKVKPLPCA